MVSPVKTKQSLPVFPQRSSSRTRFGFDKNHSSNTLAQLHIECPDGRYPKLKFTSQK